MQNATPAQPQITPSDEIASKIKNAAGWIYIIAALSLVNSVMPLLGSDHYFVVGSAIMQVIDGIGSEIGAGGKIITGVIDIIAAGIVIALGVMASKAKVWAFVTMTAIYTLDTILTLIAALSEGSVWIGFGFHCLALFYIVAGLFAARTLKKAQAAKQAEVFSEPIL